LNRQNKEKHVLPLVDLVAKLTAKNGPGTKRKKARKSISCMAHVVVYREKEVL